MRSPFLQSGLCILFLYLATLTTFSTAHAAPDPKCVDYVMTSGKVDWGGGTQWQRGNAEKLCEASKSNANIKCFQAAIAQGANWSDGIQFCREPSRHCVKSEFGNYANMDFPDGMVPPGGDKEVFKWRRAMHACDIGKKPQLGNKLINTACGKELGEKHIKALGYKGVMKLCGDSIEHDKGPAAQCYKKVVGGKFAYSKNENDTGWNKDNAIRLCANTRNPESPTDCFKAGIDSGRQWGELLGMCAPAEDGRMQRSCLHGMSKNSNTGEYLGYKGYRTGYDKCFKTAGQQENDEAVRVKAEFERLRDERPKSTCVINTNFNIETAKGQAQLMQLCGNQLHHKKYPAAACYTESMNPKDTLLKAYFTEIRATEADQTKQVINLCANTPNPDYPRRCLAEGFAAFKNGNKLIKRNDLVKICAAADDGQMQRTCVHQNLSDNKGNDRHKKAYQENFKSCFKPKGDNSKEMENLMSELLSSTCGKGLGEKRGNKMGYKTLKKLCGSNPSLANAPAAECFKTVTNGDFAWSKNKADTGWNWNNAVALCAGTIHPKAPTDCFRAGIDYGKQWNELLGRCSAEPDGKMKRSCLNKNILDSKSGKYEGYDGYKRAFPNCFG